MQLDDWVLCRIYKKNSAQRPVERDRDEDSFEGMCVTLPPNQNPKPFPAPPGRSTLSYGSIFEQDDHFFEGMLSSAGEGIHQNSCVSSSKPPPNTMSMSLVSPTSNSIKRAIPPQFWNEASGSMASSPSRKSFLGDLNSGSGTATDHEHDHDNNSFVSLLNQFPQSAQFNPNTSALLGSLGDATATLRQQFQLPAMNWNS